MLIYHWARETSDENVGNLWETVTINSNNNRDKMLKYYETPYYNFNIQSQDIKHKHVILYIFYIKCVQLF